MTAVSAETGDTGWRARSSVYTNQIIEVKSIQILVSFNLALENNLNTIIF